MGGRFKGVARRGRLGWTSLAHAPSFQGRSKRLWCASGSPVVVGAGGRDVKALGVAQLLEQGRGLGLPRLWQGTAAPGLHDSSARDA